MAKAEIIKQLKQAMLDLEDDALPKLVKKALDAGVEPMEIIEHGLAPALTEIGEMFVAQTRFMSDMVIAAEMMTDTMEILRPVMEKGAKGTGETMVIGTVQGDQHNIGKRIVGALFTGSGYRVTDIGENQSADAFVKKAKEINATVVGASVILGPLKPYCKVVSEALEQAGLRDKIIYIVGGWGMCQEWCDKVGADAWGLNGPEAIAKVKAIRAGEMKKFKDRQSKN